MLGSLGRVAGCELAGGVAVGRIGVPWAGVFGRTALAGVAAGLDAAVGTVLVGTVLVGLDLSAVSGRCSRTPFAGVIVRAVAPAAVTRGMGADGSRRTGVGAGDGGLLVVDAAGAALTGGVGACGAAGTGAVVATGSGVAAGCGAGGDDGGAGCCSAVAPAPACSTSPFSPLKSLEKIPIFDPSHHVMQSRAPHQCMPAATLPTV